MQQEEALDLLKMGKNVFLTGAAGSGKTYLLNEYVEYLKKHGVDVAITASTGIAATHLNGKTIHSWSGIGIKNNITNEDLEKLLKTARIKRNYKKAKVLIIDEISMLHAYQLDMVDRIARYMLDNDDAFGGIQVVLCGDFFQLPPVSNGFSHDSVQFAFEAEAWERGDFHICYLSEQHRQKNDPLLNVLNDIRSGTAGEHTKIPLRTRYKKQPEGDVRATKLYSRNINVDGINDNELKAINGDEKIFEMESIGFPALIEGLKKSCLALETLKLKIGAEVMFVKNSNSGNYVNGTRGVVVRFDTKGWPVVSTFDGNLVTAYPEDWQYEENGIARATITQVPLRLAWAITIHKSQGMTLDAAEMDLGDTFEPGMGYVALSRVRSLNGLKLINLNEMALKVHPQILHQDKIFQENSDEARNYISVFSEKEKKQEQNAVLVGRFSGSLSSIKRIEKKTKEEKTNKTPAHIITLSLLKKKMSVDEIAKERGIKFSTILTHLEKLKGSRQLASISDFEHLKKQMSEQAFNDILNELKKSQDGKLIPIYDNFEGKYSFEDIKLVRLFL